MDETIYVILKLLFDFELKFGSVYLKLFPSLWFNLCKCKVQYDHFVLLCSRSHISNWFLGYYLIEGLPSYLTNVLSFLIMSFYMGQHKRKWLLKMCTVKPALNGHSQKDKKLVFKTNYCLMQVKSIAECSILQYF